MNPQEHAFRMGVDVIIATPGRLLDHLRYSYAKLNQVEYLVLDEADRMLDMGFLPDIRRILKYVPAKRQTLFFSATMPPPIVTLSRDMLQDAVMIQLSRTSTPPVGITQAIYPVSQELKSTLFLALLDRGQMIQALVFTRTKHRADRLCEFLVKNGVRAERIHGNRPQTKRTEALSGFKSGKYRVLVATDIASRGIDVEALGHVVNFDVPLAPADYIHRVGRTGRAELTGEAFTLVSPQEEPDLAAIERAVGKRLPRVTMPDFDYGAQATVKLEVPHAERIAKIRATKAEQRARTAEKEARRTGGRPSGPRAADDRSAPRPGARPAARPGARPDARPGARPAARPAARSAARPAARPGSRPGARPGGSTSRPNSGRPASSGRREGSARNDRGGDGNRADNTRGDTNRGSRSGRDDRDDLRYRETRRDQ